MLQQLLSKRLETDRTLETLKEYQKSTDKELRSHFESIAQKAKEDFNRTHDLYSISHVGILSPFAEYICAVSAVVRGNKDKKEYTFAGDSTEASVARKFLYEFFIKETGLSKERVAVLIGHPVVLW